MGGVVSRELGLPEMQVGAGILVFY
jgi:hypothetical protein